MNPVRSSTRPRTPRMNPMGSVVRRYEIGEFDSAAFGPNECYEVRRTIEIASCDPRSRSLGAMSHLTCFGPPGSTAKHSPEPNRGQRSQPIERRRLAIANECAMTAARAWVISETGHKAFSPRCRGASAACRNRPYRMCRRWRSSDCTFDLLRRYRVRPKVLAKEETKKCHIHYIQCSSEFGNILR
jgi:hypothetical protein